ncbi:MAG TPA: hypothetical protein VGL66_17885 [Caulobacteraceae bacterium]|jgi:hypothetical protein
MKSLVVAVALAALAIPAMAVAQDTMQPIPNPPEGSHHHSMHHMMRHMKHKLHHMMHHMKHHDDKGHK